MRIKLYILSIVFSGFASIQTGLAQSHLDFEAAQVFSTFKFSTSINETDKAYSHVIVDAYNLGYLRKDTAGFFVRGGIGMRKSGAALVYKKINYLWNLQYIDFKAGVGYQFSRWRLKPYETVSIYYARLLSAKQTVGQLNFDLIASKTMSLTDYGVYATFGFKTDLSDHVTIYSEYNYILGLRNIETSQGQYLYNRGFSFNFGVLINISTPANKPPVIIKGKDGLNGRDGRDGIAGATGPTGPAGEIGAIGATGATGAAGATGNAGLPAVQQTVNPVNSTVTNSNPANSTPTNPSANNTVATSGSTTNPSNSINPVATNNQTTNSNSGAVNSVANNTAKSAPANPSTNLNTAPASNSVTVTTPVSTTAKTTETVTSPGTNLINSIAAKNEIDAFNTSVSNSELFETLDSKKKETSNNNVVPLKKEKENTAVIENTQPKSTKKETTIKETANPGIIVKTDETSTVLEQYIYHAPLKKSNSDKKVEFRVQISTVKTNSITDDNIVKNSKGQITTSSGKDGYTRFYYGSFQTFEEAVAKQAELKSKYPDGYIVAFKEGKSISIAAAKALLK